MRETKALDHIAKSFADAVEEIEELKKLIRSPWISAKEKPEMYRDLFLHLGDEYGWGSWDGYEKGWSICGDDGTPKTVYGWFYVPDPDFHERLVKND